MYICWYIYFFPFLFLTIINVHCFIFVLQLLWHRNVPICGTNKGILILVLILIITHWTSSRIMSDTRRDRLTYSWRSTCTQSAFSVKVTTSRLAEVTTSAYQRPQYLLWNCGLLVDYCWLRTVVFFCPAVNMYSVHAVFIHFGVCKLDWLFAFEHISRSTAGSFSRCLTRTVNVK